MNLNSDGEEDLGEYQVTSRREIIALMRNLRASNQLVRMIYSGGAEAVVTSVLAVDEPGGCVVVDAAPGQMQNQRIVDSSNVSFETMLERIRILFYTPQVERCDYDGLPALRFAIPPSLVRLQRREFYRVPTTRCTMHMPFNRGDGTPVEKVVVSVHNISAGGIGFIDEKMVLDNALGRMYPDCEIAIPGTSSVIVNVKIHNTTDVTLATGRAIRRIGGLFVDLPKPTLAAIQRYITKIERDQNAKSTGMG